MGVTVTPAGKILGATITGVELQRRLLAIAERRGVA